MNPHRMKNQSEGKQDLSRPEKPERFSVVVEKFFFKVLAVLACWELLFLWIANPFVFPSPLQVLKLAWLELFQQDFWIAVVNSLLRILFSTVLSLCAGLAAAFGGLLFPLMKKGLDQITLLMQTIPSAAYLIVLLFWFPRNMVIILVIFFLVFPVCYFSFSARLQALKERFTPLFQYYPNSFWDQIRYAYLPHMARVIFLNLEQGSSLAIKSCIMAEILVSASRGIGASLQQDRLFLNLDGVFSWVLWLICLSFMISYGIRAIKTLFFKTYL